MKDKKLQNGINEIRNITMTSDEKNHILEHVLTSQSLYTRPVRSFWTTYSFFYIKQKNPLIFYFAVFFIAVFFGGGIVFASQESLPNSIFYPIKINVLEPIHGALTFSLKEKAKYESILATKRLKEAETLSSQGKLDLSIEKKINNLLEINTASFNKTLNEINKTESNEDRDEIVINFHAEMNAHARILEIIKEQENKLEEKDKENTISETARIGAEKAVDVSKNKENNKEENNSYKYNTKRNTVRVLIDKTSFGIGDNTTVFLPKKEIVDSAQETIDQAKEFLNEADKHEEKGDREDAYSDLLKSESYVKEAGIFLKTGLNLKENIDSRKESD